MSAKLPHPIACTQNLWRIALALAWDRLYTRRPEQLRLFDERRRKERKPHAVHPG